MFAAPLAIVSYALIHDRWQLVTVIVEYDPHQHSRTSFIEFFSGNYAAAGDESFRYRLAESGHGGTLRDFYTKETLGCDETSCSCPEGDARK
ncbi:hypothetical protein [Lewinella sp. IMCC34183]|uniref:hypothetical protein n=1 Tax=Lewinella sp. IMCC34183 TaxID=2248762 RepID=UPI000E24342A|nr:hypothetical protein [Lewinella sp. IMCC34183]